MYMGTSREIIFIQTLKNNLDHSFVRSLLFMHAISGCDTTSRPYGIGKVTVISKYTALSRAADVFLSAKADIAKLGEKAVMVIRGCTSSLTLNDACVARLLQRVYSHFNPVCVPGKLHHTSDTQSPNLSSSSSMVWQIHTCRKMK